VPDDSEDDVADLDILAQAPIVPTARKNRQEESYRRVQLEGG
jgi:hypothetical protein